jgi:hypothetical protein
MVFLAIMLLLLIGYGVAINTLIFFDRPWDETTFARLFYRCVPALEAVLMALCPSGLFAANVIPGDDTV